MSGSQIGGVVGAIAGSFIPGVGTQLGYAIGSAIGGYIDPTKIQGPRLTDATAQTSNVGVPLPFGYGVFPTAGNVIWADELKEHVKRQRQGKGGGAKTTTYTYTRSYAIGICEGPIYGYVQIKRNGKLVYTSDPNAPVSDKDYSAKWLQKVTLYYGDEEQMPDSTIEAVVGAGQVAAFRGLAYIVVENDDLTDLAGAIPQYEFVVNSTKPDVFITSHPYPIYSKEYTSANASPIYGRLKTELHLLEIDDRCEVGTLPISGELRDYIIRRSYSDDAYSSAIPLSGRLKQILTNVNSSSSSSIEVFPISGRMKTSVILTSDSNNKYSINPEPIGGILSE